MLKFYDKYSQGMKLNTKVRVIGVLEVFDDQALDLHAITVDVLDQPVTQEIL